MIEQEIPLGFSQWSEVTARCSASNGGGVMEKTILGLLLGVSLCFGSIQEVIAANKYTSPVKITGAFGLNLYKKLDPNIVKKDDIFTKFESMWVVSQKDNEYNPLHLHGTGCVSGVLYLKIPEYLPDRKKKTSKTRSRTTDGALEFVNNACLDGRFASGICSFNPEPGELYLFTGYQPHQVYPFRSVDGKGERRSVSFNADYITKEKLEEMRKKEASGKNE